MGNDLIPYEPPGAVEPFRGHYLVPKDWVACGAVIYISGAQGLQPIRQFALALTRGSLSLCDDGGPVWSQPLSAITEVRAEEVQGISFPVDTPAGLQHMIPPSAMGVAVSYKLTLTATARLILVTIIPGVAHNWVNDIQTAIYKNANDPGYGGIERR